MDTNGSNFNCELCHKIFLHKSSRNRHVREQHLQTNLYDCKHCNSRFSKKYNLQVHNKKIHSQNIKQLKCDHCTRIFKKSTNLRKHIKTHDKNCETTDSFKNVLDDAQNIAQSVLEQLKQLQKDIQPSENVEPKTLERESTDIEKVNAKVIVIKDNLYPLGHFTLVKAQALERLDGITYLRCDFCSKEFKKSYNFLRHLRIHTKVRPFVCILCKRSFPTTTRLKTHCSMHKLDEKLGLFHKLYKCPNCREGFSSIQQFDKHLSSMSSFCKATFKCPHCLKSYKTLKSLLRHKHSERDNELEMLKEILPSPIALGQESKIANDSKIFMECNFCGIQLNEKTLLKEHVKRHENLYKNQCAKCHCFFANQSALKIHSKIHINTTRHFKCQYCNKCFKSAQSCRRHMLIHLKQLLKSNEGLQYQSNALVSYPIFIENEMKGEIERTTSIIKLSKEYKTKQEATSSEVKHVKYKCEECDKSFRYRAWLRKHFKYKHTEDFPYECSKCLRKFRTKQSLESHLLVHSLERTKITCQVCGRQYATSKSLKLHLRIHTQEKPFNCNVCCKLFRTSGHLIQHRKANHKE